MPKAEVKLHYKNVMADVIGDEHGITPAQLKDLAKQTSPLIQQLNEERGTGKIPYRDLPYNSEISREVKELVKELKGRCENLVVFGIGGSALGSIALQTALNPYMHNLDDAQRTGPRLFVFDNIDPMQLNSFLKWLNNNDRLNKTIFNVISKTGTAAETMSQFMVIRKLLTDKLGPESLRNHVIVITGPDENPLRRIAAKDKFPDPLEVPEGVGGRFSVLSAVGLFSAAMCGIDIDSLLAGARDMDTRVKCEDFYRNPAAINAAINYHFYNHGKNISVIMPYSYHLKDLADWFRQLWAESLGKAEDMRGNQVHIGPTPVKALGATDQHSQLQLYLEGPNDKLITFLQVNNFGESLEVGPVPDYTSELHYLGGKNLGTLLNNEKKATEYSLLKNKHPCLTVLFDEVNAYTVGQFIYLYEVTTSLTGALFGINPYDQPSVKAVREAIPALSSPYSPGDEEWAKEIRSIVEVDDRFLV